MSRIYDIFYDPSTGLLPYLEKQLETNYQRFLIRTFDFGSANLKAGFRLRDLSDRYEGEMAIIRQGVVLGRAIAVTDSGISQIRAAELARDMDRTVKHWSRCVTPYLQSEVDEFSGTLALTQDRNITGENPAAWWVAVVRSFEISYIDLTG